MRGSVGLRLTMGSCTLGSALILLDPLEPREGGHVSQATQQGGCGEAPNFIRFIPPGICLKVPVAMQARTVSTGLT